MLKPLIFDQLSKTLKRAIDLTKRIDWGILSTEQQHSKVIDLTQVVINDLFGMIASSYVEDDAALIVSDFQKTFYPEGSRGGERDLKIQSADGFTTIRPPTDPLVAQVTQVNNSAQDRYKSLDHFATPMPKVDAPFGTLSQSLEAMDLGSPGKTAARLRSMGTTGSTGTGVFEKIGTDLALLKPGLEMTEQDPINEIKTLCMKIYRSTNLRYQNISKLVLRNKADELRAMVQMPMVFEIPRHMALVLMKIDVQNEDKQVLFLDGPEKQIDVLDMKTLEKKSSIHMIGDE